MCCFGYAISKKRKTKVKPFTDIKTIDVYENKYKITTIIPNNSTKPNNYKNYKN